MEAAAAFASQGSCDQAGQFAFLRTMVSSDQSLSVL